MGSSAEKNVHLPTDIVEFQILTRLAVKSLLRFKSVCKSWNSLISKNQVFMQTHLGNSKHDYLMAGREDPIQTFSPFEIKPIQTLIGCIDGLLCFSTQQMFGIKFTISNPATKHVLDIRALPVKRFSDFFGGFGYNSITNDYKVVYIKSNMKQASLGFIYSTSAHRWRKIAPSNNFNYTGMALHNPEKNVIVNDSLYLLNRQTESSLTVISFDFRHEVFRLLPGSFDGGKDYVLVNMGDSVALMRYCYWTLSTIDIYIFDERCSLWSKMMHIGPLIGTEPSFMKFFIGCLRNNDILFGDSKFRFYRVNPQTHSIIETSEVKGDKNIFKCLTYSESLIFIQGMETLPWYDDEDEDLIARSIIQEHYRRSGLLCKCSYTQI